MKKALLCLPFAFFVSVLLVRAQSNCGNGLPCGPVPWRIPNLPDLPSPTYVPTVAITQASGNPGDTPVPTATPTPAATFFDSSQIQNQVGTLQAAVNATQIPLQDFNGTPVDVTAVFSDMSTNSESFFSYAKGVSSLDLGILTPMLLFLFTSMLGVIVVKLFTFALPFLLAIFGLIRRIYHVIMDFIPL